MNKLWLINGGVPLSDPQLGARGFITQSQVDINTVWNMDE
jgi:hypothetical protein